MNAVERKTWIESIMARLRRHYAEQMPLPVAPWLTITEDQILDTLTLPQLHRLFRYVIAEYGD